MNTRPAYTDEELLVLSRRPGVFRWVTCESRPRRVRVLARLSSDPNYTVVRLGHEDEPHHLLSCGDPDDGYIRELGLWIQRDPSDTASLAR